MKMRKKIFLMLLIMLLAMSLMGAGCSEEQKEESSEKEERVFQIQRMVDISLEDETIQLPYKVLTHAKSTDAFNNPISVYVSSGETAKINFSFTSEEGETLKSVKDGMVIETNETMPGAENVNVVGDIATFQLQLTPQSELSTVVYELVMEKEKKEEKKPCNRFIAFRMSPKEEQELQFLQEETTEEPIPEPTK